MSIVTAKASWTEKDEPVVKAHHQLVTSEAGDSDILLVPEWAKIISMQIILTGAATVTLKHTHAHETVVNLGLCTFQEDSIGTISSNDALDMDAGPTAIKFTQAGTGTATVEVTFI